MKVCIGLSGGVDSSVAAHLLLEKGYELIGCTMRTFDTERAEKEREDAEAVAESLGIPFYVVDYRERFKKDVIEYFAYEYTHGRTPNPCIICNRKVKWEALMACAAEHGAERVATGHYARIEKDAATGRYAVRKAVTAAKDQSYALYNLKQEQLAATIFPVGGFSKDEIRSTAEKIGLFTADKPDSQEICFIPDKDYAGFISEQLKIKTDIPGNYVDEKGNILGKHSGIVNYTIGQRKGLGIALGKRTFVKEIRPLTNEVVLADADSVWTDRLSFTDFNGQLADESMLKEGLAANVKIRYSDKGCEGLVKKREDMSGGDKAIYDISFKSPVRAVTPGQAAVLYDSEGRILGGGIICS